MLAFEAPWASVLLYCSDYSKVVVAKCILFFLLVFVTRSYCVAQADLELM